MALPKAYKLLAQKLSEAASLSHDNIRQRLQAALRSAADGEWVSVLDVFGSDTEGEVVYYSGSEIYRCKYSITADGAQSLTSLDDAVEVTPRISYEVVADAEEITSTEVALCEGGEFSEAVAIREARSDYEIKLIAPGKGSTAFYTEAALRASGPQVFKAGTHMHWNHPTASEESERPERDLNTLAAVLTTDAEYREGPKGPGLYARAKVFSDYADQVESKAAHIGLSIMASGVAETKDGRVVMRDGVPVLKEFTRAQSTDFVTRAGAGGLILTEGAPAPTIDDNKGATMDEKQIKELQESNALMLAELRKLKDRAALSDAAGVVREILVDLQVSEAIAKRVSGRVLLGSIPTTDAGELDRAKLKAIVEAEAKEECAYVAQVSGGRIVTGMGVAPIQTTEAEAAERKRNLEAEADAFAAGLGLKTKEARAIMTQGRSAFRATFINAGGEQ